MPDQTEKRVYIVACEDRLYEAASFGEAILLVASKCSSNAQVYKAARILALSGEEVRDLQRILKHYTTKTLRSQAPKQENEITQLKGVSSKAEYAVIFDQMYKGFADILAREITLPSIEFHEILGRGIAEPLKVSDRVYRQPARDDYDILKLLEKLTNQYRKGVLFFTGDKRLANQARLVPGVHVEYIPPGEVAGKEMALRLMSQRIKSWIEGESKSRQVE
ncbi:MAG TPA: hypothetical protein EYP33_08230 [Pyrodictium sp.]|nr:hypothetical protein [Pyrodictium sp.]